LQISLVKSEAEPETLPNEILASELLQLCVNNTILGCPLILP